MSDDTQEEKELIQYDELGNRFVYNQKTGFWEFSPKGESTAIPITDFAY